MIRGISKFALILTFLVFLSSCNSNVMYTESVAMPNETWGLMNVPTFRMSVTDTANSNNVFFTIRTGTSYPFRNIFLFATATSPDGKSITDTLQFNLADEKGNWYGKGFGDIHELNLPYKTNVFFPGKGIYQFKIQHGMRLENLVGVYDIGVRVEKISK